MLRNAETSLDGKQHVTEQHAGSSARARSVARVDSRPLTDGGSRLEAVAAALADRAAEVEIVVHDARDGDSSAAATMPVAALEGLLAEARAEAAAAREELTARLAGEAELLVTAGRLRLELDELRERLAARDERDARVAGLVAEVADAAREAREEVQRHAAARERAELDLAAARERLEALHADLEALRARTVAAEQALRTELDAAHTARDRALAAEDAASAAREAELSALKAAHARLRPAGGPAAAADDSAESDPAGDPSDRAGAPRPGEPPAEQLADGLARAAQRLRDASPPAPPPVEDEEPAPAPPAPLVAAPQRRPVGPPGILRRLFHRHR